MLTIWIYTLLSVVAISLISLVGVLTLYFSLEKLNKVVFYMVSFAAGTLLGDAFLHLIPESFENGIFTSSAYVLLGIVIFFILEKFIHWHHCHDEECEQHPQAFSYLILMGDAIHNLLDGIIIAASYLVSIPVGVATTVAVAFHEIPQELGDFGVLVHNGLSRRKALYYNFITAITAFGGAIIILFLSTSVENITNALVPIAAGGLIYVANSDIIPELHKTTVTKKSILGTMFMFAGIGVMYLLLFVG